MDLEVEGFNSDSKWDYENGYWLTSPIKRLGKTIAQYEIYKRIINLPGHVVEVGVFKGSSIIRLLTYRDMLESTDSRKVIGFDVFGEFPEQRPADDQAFIERFTDQAGDGFSRGAIDKVLTYKGFRNYELVKGDICDTVPAYVSRQPELRISLLHIDVDVYLPTQVTLECLYSKVVKGGIVMFDDYATVSGETNAVEEFFHSKDVEIQKLPISHIPSFVVKT